MNAKDDGTWESRSLIGLAAVLAGAGIGVGAAYFGYNSGNVRTVRIEMDYYAAQILNNRTEVVQENLKANKDRLSSQELSDILKKLAEPPKIELCAEKKE